MIKPSFFDFVKNPKLNLCVDNNGTFFCPWTKKVQIQIHSMNPAITLASRVTQWCTTIFQCRSSMTGFKKTIYNRAKLVRNQLYPSYNRRII
jgi:hypothetical protein